MFNTERFIGLVVKTIVILLLTLFGLFIIFGVIMTIRDCQEHNRNLAQNLKSKQAIKHAFEQIKEVKVITSFGYLKGGFNIYEQRQGQKVFSFTRNPMGYFTQECLKSLVAIFQKSGVQVLRVLENSDQSKSQMPIWRMSGKLTEQYDSGLFGNSATLKVNANYIVQLESVDGSQLWWRHFSKKEDILVINSEYPAGVAKITEGMLPQYTNELMELRRNLPMLKRAILVLEPFYYRNTSILSDLDKLDNN